MSHQFPHDRADESARVDRTKAQVDQLHPGAVPCPGGFRCRCHDDDGTDQ